MKKDKSTDCYNKLKNKEFTVKSQKLKIIKLMDKINL